MKARVALITEIIAPYRIPVFNALARRPEIDLHVIFLAETDPTQRHWPVYQSEIEFSYQVLPSWRRRIGAHHVLLNRGTAAGLRRAAPEVILCGGYNYPASWTAWRWAHRDQLPFLLWVESTARDLRNRRRVVEWAKERFIRGCAGFVVPGQSSRKYLRSFGVDEKAIFTAPNAVDNDLFAAHAEQARREADRRRSELGLAEHFFLFVGRLIESKGIFDLLDAYGKLAPDLQREWGLVFVGDGDAAPELRRRVASLPSGRVIVADSAQREQLGIYYGLAGAFVFPTHSDPWGLVVNEAMACALPVIASRAAGCTADLVGHGENGLVVDPGDVAQLVSAMTEIASSAERREKMGAAGRERIARYSPVACAEGIAHAAVASRRT